MKNVTYFDNAATSWPKPKEVLNSMKLFLNEIGGSPGRSGHRMSIAASRLVEETRESVCKLFNYSDTSRIIFTKNVTEALNLSIFSFLKDGGHIITSSMEHNSVMRPLRYLECRSVDISIANCYSDGSLDPEEILKKVKANTKLIILTHASNVTGTILPIEEVAAGALEMNIPLLIDCAQTAGALPINLDLNKFNNCVLALTGHKSLLGPTGTGGICVGSAINLKPLIFGGTGSKSNEDIQPEFLPDKLESGTMNILGLAGLKAGIDFLLKKNILKIREHEKKLVQNFMSKAEEIKGIKIYGTKDANKQIGIISFNIENISPSYAGLILDHKYLIMCRIGLHCNPNAHKTIETFPDGTIRFSFSYFNTIEQIEASIVALKEIAKIKF